MSVSSQEDSEQQTSFDALVRQQTSFVHICLWLDPSDLQSLLCTSKATAEAAHNPLVASEYVIQRATSASPVQKPAVLDLLRTRVASAFNDDQLYIAVSHLLKHGAEVTPCKPPAARKVEVVRGAALASANGNGTHHAPEQQQQQQHEVAWLTQRVATRTLALLIKQRPHCADCIKEYDTLKAGVLSNKEYTLLFLTARGADFKPHYDRLTSEAIEHGASKALPWLLQWQEVTPEKLQAQLQAGLPDPAATGCAEVAATLEVLLVHGLSANCTVTCTPRGARPTASDPGAEHSLLEWAVLYAAEAAKLHEAKQQPATAAGTAVRLPPRTSSNGRLNDGLARRSGSVPDLSQMTLAASATPSAGGSEGGAPRAQYFGPELVRVVLAKGAAVNARRGGALLLAAQALRGELVSELVAGGADVTLPRLPSGSDLLRWAVDSRACPAATGVLQALLAGVKSQAPPAATGPRAGSPDAHSPSPSPAPGTSAQGKTAGEERLAVRDRVSRPSRGPNGGDMTGPPTPSAATAGSAKAVWASGAHATVALSPSPAASPGTALLGACTPMVTLGGALTAKPAEAPAVTPGGTDGERPGRASKNGGLLPSTLVSELQRDAAFLEAVNRNDLQVTKCLLEAGADVHSRNDKAILLAMGAIDNDNPDGWMRRPRDRAPVLSMSRPMVDLLLAHGADVNARQGRAMCQAARWRDTLSIEYLLSLPGADKTWMDKDAALQQQQQGRH